MFTNTRASYLASLFLSSLALSANASKLVVFGNSLSDVWNKINFVDSHFAVPYFFGRYASGPVWNEYLTHFNNYTLINYAVGGALSNNTFINDIVGTNITLPSAMDQISMFQDVFSPLYTNKTDLKSDIAVVEIGGNDIFYSSALVLNNTVNPETFAKNMVDNIMSSANKLVDFGYVNIIVAQIPNLATSPFSKSLTVQQRDFLSALVVYANKLIAEKVASLDTTLQNSSGWAKVLELFDLFQLIVDESDITKALNITVLDKECYVTNEAEDKLLSSCDNPDNHLYIDLYHPETRPHSLIGALASEMLGNSSFSLNKESTLYLISKYNISDFGYSKNALFTSTSNSTGFLNIKEFNITSSKSNAKSIASGTNPSSKISGSSMKLKPVTFGLVAFVFSLVLL
ncbi:Phosphatidylcholine-sterol acyltransferase [Smittium culicis]|uniref:Phosphatidylcholine-sterol acyltransferase n=1 Tax=Smittium culicis TaxID=133412 RepID=A0A1R1YHJ2_9FUNG|nr:Phosphatidylcholine-sterol acyltransferase [Smittium culicis]